MRGAREKLIELYNKWTGKTGKRNQEKRDMAGGERGSGGQTLQQLINLTFYCQFAFKSMKGCDLWIEWIVDFSLNMCAR